MAAETFRLLDDPTRLRILLVGLDGPRSVCRIAADTGASPSVVWRDLRLLRGARLVQSQRDARQVFCQAPDRHVRHMIEDILAHSAEADGGGRPAQLLLRKSRALADNSDLRRLAFGKAGAERQRCSLKPSSLRPMN